MTVIEYIKELNAQYKTGKATEHSYRPALKELLQSLLPKMTIINEPKRYNFGAPDYILIRGDVPVAFIEAKDFAKTNDLSGRKENREQFDRYKQSLDNIIFTDYLDFWLYRNGEFVDSVRLAELKGDKIMLVSENEAKFVALIEHLGNAQPQKITSSKKLAEIMAGKARLLADVIRKSLTEDIDEQNALYNQMHAIKDVLMDDITPERFADIYAQTIAYGMFAARLHDTTPDTFSRKEAAELIPRTNPFLRQMFQYIAGYDLDERVAWIVDDLAEAFRASDITKIMKGYGKRTRQTDPMIHFYEDFLKAYNPKLRKNCGVYYTPQPVVSYIVRAVDEILQSEFSLADGLADTSKTKMSLLNQKVKKKDKDTYDVTVHKVQILDPATGTGTFLAEVIHTIHNKMAGQQGMWQSYVENHLLPRLNGFELMMASYAMAHLKLDMVLAETGYKPKNNERLRVYLTNSLEEHHNEMDNLWSYAFSQEANGASRLKRDYPVMVVLGNPPYSGESNNKSPWILSLMDSYKREPNTNEPLKERNPKWINDDYCKFIRLGQSFVDKNSEGVMAYINNHSFLDNPTFRGMRWSLMQSFDKIYIIDLHGNSKKKEVCPDGSKDENVFDIQQGVSINIFIKNGKKHKGELAEVYHYDLYGKRDVKYNYLLEHSFSTTDFTRLSPTAPFYFFVNRSTANEEVYNRGFSVNDMFPLNNVGVVTSRDGLVIDSDKEALLSRIKYFADPTMSDGEVRTHFFGEKGRGDYLAGDNRDWKMSIAKASIASIDHSRYVKPMSYRPFDTRYIYYHSAMIDFGREKVMQHFLIGDNVGIVVGRQCVSDWRYAFVTDKICEFNLTGTAGRFGSGYVFPLYTYNSIDNNLFTRRPNLNMEIVGEIADRIGLTFEAEPNDNEGAFSPIDLLDYIYGVLHSPSYREQFKEFLKVDFPRIPYPTDANEFRRVSEIGGELREVHLMEVKPPIQTQFNVSGSNVVEATKITDGDSADVCKVWINAEQYFDNVPRVAWEFYIGGYQPAQKWLKDRKGMTLEWDDVIHYQRIIAALCKTHELMQQLEEHPN
ncbi:MAG: DNA methyltransferase [Rikenellaceae bacterium]|nr:DNA methyltransferase [Rikenellaceae bacterium]